MGGAGHPGRVQAAVTSDLDYIVGRQASLSAPASSACTKTLQASASLFAESARGRGRAATAHVLAAPSELTHRPLLDQAVVAPMVPSVAVIRQRRRRWGRRWWRGRWAGLAPH